MELFLKRIAPRPNYTIGRLSINSEPVFCDTLEDRDRGLTSKMTAEEIKLRKVQGETAIPKGRYRIDMETISPKYAAVNYYYSKFGGKLPRLVGVPGFSGILIHAGNTADDSAGCILVGQNKEVGKVLNSRATLERLYARLKEAHEAGEEIWITIS